MNQRYKNMTPEQLELVADELARVMGTAIDLAKAEARINDLERAEADRAAERDARFVAKVFETASPSDRIRIALAGTGRNGVR